MAEPFIGEIRAWGCTFAPRDWAACDGQLLPISQHTALFSIIGSQFGGDGRTTFALPNLGGRVPLGPGSGPGLTPRHVGEAGGEAAVTLTGDELPTHSHGMRAVSSRAGSPTPSETSVLAASSRDPLYGSSAPATALAGSTVSTESGGGGAHDNMMPFQALNFCIALTGVFPARE
ncbi:MAG: phage tail protein [Gemmatimonadota bacterium]